MDLQPVASGRGSALARIPLATLGLALQERAAADRCPTVAWLNRGVSNEFFQ